MPPDILIDMKPAPPIRSVGMAVTLLAAVACGGATEGAPSASGITLFEGATLIVGDGSAPIENAVLLV